MSLKKVLISSLAAAAYAAPVHEYVAMVPAAADAQPGQVPIVEWLELKYDDETSAKTADVEARLVNKTEKVEALGSWAQLDLSKGGGNGAMLSAKVLGDQMLVLTAVKATPDGAGGGCCADTIRVYEKDATFADVDIDAILATVFPSDVTNWVHATHTFDTYKDEKDGKTYALLQVQYADPHVVNNKVNSIVKVDIAAKAAVKTKDGEGFWSIENRLGAETFDFNSSVYKLQYVNKTLTKRGGEEWHGNGVLRFTSKAGDVLLAMTHRFFMEAFIVKDPWTYSKAEGADAILQRFGTSPFTSAGATEAAPTFHRFGLPSYARQWTGGVHNVWYTPSTATTSGGIEGKETITLFVNSIDGRVASFVFEFELNLKPEDPKVPPSDGVFETTFTFAETHFKAMAMGGARVLANGVYVVASGGGAGGVFEIIDATNTTKQSFTYPGPTGAMTNLYDTFARVVV